MLLKRISRYLNDEQLPGREAQLAFANKRAGKIGHLLELSENPVLAGTLCLLFPSATDPNALDFSLIERTSLYPNDPHAGQISFPGGKMEDSDKNIEETALREAHEEIGINATDVTILGRLSQLFISVSNYLVHPHVGYLDYRPSFTLQESEVASILTPSLNSLLNPDNIKHRDIAVRGMTLKGMPYFDLEGKVVWGATAMMLNEFRIILQEIS